MSEECYEMLKEEYENGWNECFEFSELSTLPENTLFQEYVKGKDMEETCDHYLVDAVIPFLYDYIVDEVLTWDDVCKALKMCK